MYSAARRCPWLPVSRPSNLSSARKRMCDHQSFFAFHSFVLGANGLQLPRVAFGVVGIVLKEPAQRHRPILGVGAGPLEGALRQVFQQFVILCPQTPEGIERLGWLAPPIV